jgi:anthranilate synthase component 1
MKKILIRTECKKLLADVFTPVSIYLRLRDRFRDTILLESTDHHASANSWSFIGINAIAGIELESERTIEWKLPGQPAERIGLQQAVPVADLLNQFMQRFEAASDCTEAAFAQGLYGYTAYDAIPFFETVTFSHDKGYDDTGFRIPKMRYRLYQYVIAINHHKDELHLLENCISGIPSDMQLVERIIQSRDVPEFPFRSRGEEVSNLTDEQYLDMVNKGISHCKRGDVFQIVLSRRFSQSFEGDEFNVYRSLRSINPSPYLFFFDYGDYKLMGSSPESQLIIANGKATVHPIAGTFRRTGDDEIDQQEAEKLKKDLKENAEHVMLVDLARNDLSRCCDEVSVARFRQVQFYSHVIHLVSEVVGNVPTGSNPFDMLAKTFPAGTLSGAPKIKAMELIDKYEPNSRGYYGGAIGFMGFNGSCNHAIMIRTFLSHANTLHYQAGAGIVAVSRPESELQEVNNKLGALKKAIQFAGSLHRSNDGTLNK